MKIKKKKKKKLGRNKNRGERKEKIKEKKKKKKKIKENKNNNKNLIKLFFLLFLNDSVCHVSNFRLPRKQFLTELTQRVKLRTA